MKTYYIRLEDFESDVVASMNFDASTIEGAALSLIAEQIAQQIEPEKPENSLSIVLDVWNNKVWKKTIDV